MLIGVDGNEANVEKKVGVSVYTFTLLKYFQKWANKDIQFLIYLKSNPLPELPQENNSFKYRVIKGKFLWSQIFLPINLFFNKNINLFFSPAHYSPNFLKPPLVVTIHDLSYFYYPEEFLKKDLYQLINWTKYSVKKAKKIIAVSKTTKKDLIKFYQAPEEKIEVVYNGYEKLLTENPKESFYSKNTLIEKNKYLLYVGTVQPRKNLITLIKAFALFSKNYPDFKLLIVGKKGWLYQEIFKKVKEMSLEKKVIFTDYIKDEQLIFLYRNAFCLVLPSFYEGFGIPILEAMNFNCPVISSFASSLPEIGNNACLYFNPESVNDLFDKINQLKGNKNLRKELIKKGKERLKNFSWEKCARETLKILIKAYENKNY